jgi:hypothetical protein
MKRRTPNRLFTTLLVVVSLLFAQIALAQFVCPVAQANESETMAMAKTMDMAPGVPCDMDHEQDTQPALCHHHCTNAAQSFEPVKVPVVSLPAIVQVLVVPLHVDGAIHDAAALATQGEAQPPPSPVFLSTLRLRV